MLTGKQRAFLRGKAAAEQPIFQIGKGGVTEEIIKQLSNALEARELIKVRVLDNAEEDPYHCANTIAPLLGADVVSVIGSKFVLYRRSEKKQRIFSE